MLASKGQRMILREYEEFSTSLELIEEYLRLKGYPISGECILVQAHPPSETELKKRKAVEESVKGKTLILSLTGAHSPSGLIKAAQKWREFSPAHVYGITQHINFTLVELREIKENVPFDHLFLRDEPTLEEDPVTVTRMSLLHDND